MWGPGAALNASWEDRSAFNWVCTGFNSSSGILKPRNRKSVGEKKSIPSQAGKMEHKMRSTETASLAGLCSHFAKILKSQEDLMCTHLLLMIS